MTITSPGGRFYRSGTITARDREMFALAVKAGASLDTFAAKDVAILMGITGGSDLGGVAQRLHALAVKHMIDEVGPGRYRLPTENRKIEYDIPGSIPRPPLGRLMGGR